MQEPVLVAGVGMTAFKKPGDNRPYPEMAAQAIRQALQDAGLACSDVQDVYAGYVHGDSACGQRAVYEVGMTGVPVINVNNNCASGSTALYLARKAVANGSTDCALAVGFEQMPPGALKAYRNDRPDPLDRAFVESDSNTRWRRCRRQSLGRTVVERPSAGRNRPCAVLRADPPDPGQCRGAPGGGRAVRPAAQRGPGRHRCDPVRARRLRSMSW